MKTLEKYFKNRETTINLLLERPRNKYTQGTYHTLRVEIKKLNALFDLLDYCLNDFKRKKTFKPFKLIFQQAGKIRELELEEAMLKKYLQNNSLLNFRNKVKRQRLKEQEKFFTMLDDKLILKLKREYHKVTPLLKLVDKKKADRYLWKKRSNIRKLLSLTTLKTSQVHELRKRLKMFIFNEKSLTLTMKVKPDFTKDVLPKLLGKWHDCQVLIRQIVSAMNSGGINSNEKRLLEKIKTKISSERDIFYNKIIKVFPED
jgi:hypothetical protein